MKQTKHIHLPILSLCLIITLGFATVIWSSAVITNFRGEPGKNKVVLKWSSLSEVGCKEYVIERGMDRYNFTKVGTVDAAGNSSERKDYEYQDSSVFKTMANTFFYRIRIVDENGNDKAVSEVVTVTPAVSGVRHTWGSIKAMFR
ncbi:hypothetical protein JW960_19815 [candidate division KSB1 bacterium]|nr:hypothetical protein [candidate division KSB1 bacterium]